ARGGGPPGGRAPARGGGRRGHPDGPARRGRTDARLDAMAVLTETIQVSGIRCERCVMRLGKVLEGVEGIEAATANLMGQVTLAWDDQRTDRTAILAGLARGGFHALAPGG